MRWPLYVFNLRSSIFLAFNLLCFPSWVAYPFVLCPYLCCVPICVICVAYSSVLPTYLDHIFCVTLSVSHFVCHILCVTFSVSHFVCHNLCVTICVSHVYHIVIARGGKSPGHQTLVNWRKYCMAHGLCPLAKIKNSD